MPEASLLERAITLGLGALIAVVVLIWKRSDDARYAKSIEDTNVRLFIALEAVTQAMIGVRNAVESQETLNELREEMRKLRDEAERGHPG